MIDVRDINTMWEADGGDSVAFFQGDLEELASKFYAPLFLEDGRAALILYDKSIGNFSVTQADDVENQEWLEIVVNANLLQQKDIKKTLKKILGAEIDYFWTDEPFGRSE